MVSKEDLFHGYLFYERQQAGIGDYFLDSLSADIESLLLHHRYPGQFLGFHRMIVRLFPFFIYERVSDETIYVDAVVAPWDGGFLKGQKEIGEE